jgi:hypothetical protein
MNGEVRECLREHDVHTRDNRRVSVQLPTQRVLGARCANYGVIPTYLRELSLIWAWQTVTLKA